MKNIKEEIALEITEKILDHISVIYDDVDETMNLIENLPLVLRYKKRIKELEMRLMDANKTILLLKSSISDEKNLHLEVSEKVEHRQIITKDEIEKSLEEQEKKTFTIDYGLSGLNTGLWDFKDDDDAAMTSDNGEENDDANEIGSEVYDMLKAIKEKVNVEKLDNCETVINNEEDENNSNDGDEVEDNEEGDEEDGDEEEGDEEEGDEEEDEEEGDEEELESGEEEDFVVEEILLNDKKYYTNDPRNGIIFEYLEDEEIGEEIGYLENGQLFIS